MMAEMELIDFVEYEIASSWLCGWPWPKCIAEVLANRGIRTAKRKMKAYHKFCVLRDLRKHGATEGHVLWAIRQMRLNDDWANPKRMKAGQ